MIFLANTYISANKFGACVLRRFSYRGPEANVSFWTVISIPGIRVRSRHRQLFSHIASLHPHQQPICEFWAQAFGIESLAVADIGWLRAVSLCSEGKVQTEVAEPDLQSKGAY